MEKDLLPQAILYHELGATPDKEQEKQEKPRHLTTESGRILLEAPSPKLVERLNANPRIEYIPFIVPEDAPNPEFPFSDESVDRMIRDKSAWVIFAMCGIDPLRAKVAQDFQGRFPIAVRGTVCSVDGTFETQGLRVKDINEMLNDGLDRQENDTMVAGMTDESQRLPHRTEQWIMEGPINLRRTITDPTLAAKLFPVLLVYDRSKLIGGDRYHVSLPNNPEERAQAIIKAYVLDCPKGIKELVAQS